MELDYGCWWRCYYKGYVRFSFRGRRRVRYERKLNLLAEELIPVEHQCAPLRGRKDNVEFSRQRNTVLNPLPEEFRPRGLKSVTLHQCVWDHKLNPRAREFVPRRSDVQNWTSEQFLIIDQYCKS